MTVGTDADNLAPLDCRPHGRATEHRRTTCLRKDSSGISVEQLQFDGNTEVQMLSVGNNARPDSFAFSWIPRPTRSRMRRPGNEGRASPVIHQPPGTKPLARSTGPRACRADAPLQHRTLTSPAVTPAHRTDAKVPHYRMLPTSGTTAEPPSSATQSSQRQPS